MVWPAASHGLGDDVLDIVFEAGALACGILPTKWVHLNWSASSRRLCSDASAAVVASRTLISSSSLHLASQEGFLSPPFGRAKGLLLCGSLRSVHWCISASAYRTYRFPLSLPLNRNTTGASGVNLPLRIPINGRGVVKHSCVTTIPSFTSASFPPSVSRTFETSTNLHGKPSDHLRIGRVNFRIVQPDIVGEFLALPLSGAAPRCRSVDLHRSFLAPQSNCESLRVTLLVRKIQEAYSPASPWRRRCQSRGAAWHGKSENIAMEIEAGSDAF